MNQNNWYKKIYDDFFISMNIDTKPFHKKAKDEVIFLFEKLSMQKGQKVLDVPCGTGRHSHYLAKKGLKVTGIDISQACLKQARKKFQYKNLVFKKGCMSNLSHFSGQFDYVLNLFTSFGYFPTEKENEDVLRGMVDCLKENGKIVIQLANRHWFLKFYRSVDWHKDGNLFYSASRKYDFKQNYTEENLIVLNEKTGKAKRYYHHVRCYSKDEMVNLFKKAGLRKVKVYGDDQGNAFKKYESARPFYIGVK